MKLVRDDGFHVTITFDDLETIGLYKLALAINHPDDAWAQPAQLGLDEDVAPLAAALQVQLAAIAGP